MNHLSVKLIRDAPELAMVEVLSCALETTISALAAADPGLFCESPPPWVVVPHSTRVAERIVELAGQLHHELDEYQHAVECDLERQRQRELERRCAEDDEIPF